MNWCYENGRIYWENEDNELMAEALYCPAGKGTIDVDSTYVNPALRGQGVAGKMMETVVEFLRKNDLKAVASCPYANGWFRKHREAQSDVIAPNFDQIQAKESK